MALKTVEEENREEIEVFDQCYLCKKWWWQRTMKHVLVPDQDGYVRKYVCAECLRDVNDRSYMVIDPGMDTEDKDGFRELKKYIKDRH